MIIFWLALAALIGLVIYDLTQTRYAILRNFPVIGHLRYLLQAIGPELRQYIVTSNDEERPFTRDQRHWVYTSAGKQNNYFGFGTDNELERTSSYLILKQATFPLPEPRLGEPGYDPQYSIPCAKVLGAVRGRKHAFRPASVVNISAMSFGSLSAPAVEALNRGAALCGCLHNTGEGGIAPYHRKGGELIWQLGTGYFGARGEHGRFSMERFLEGIASAPVRTIEVKLSQGAKPGKGGILPAAKITPQIASIRGIPEGKDCLSPASHAEFHDADSLLDFVESLAEASGLPVGIKSAVGKMAFWEELADLMEGGSRGVDFIAIDGGEGGTGAAPLAFTDHVSLPFKLGMSRVYQHFAKRGLADQLVWVGAGKLGFPETALLAFALGCDMVAVAREPMLAIGCIQAQRCHSGHCPTGVATQNKWLARGLDPTSKADRLANYVLTLRHDLLSLCRAAGVAHPGLLDSGALEILGEGYTSRTVAETFGYEPEWSLPAQDDQQEIQRLMRLDV